MDTITAYAIAGIGFVCGYAIFFSLKRYLPPISNQPTRPQEIRLVFVSLSAGSFLGKEFTALDSVNYIGPNGLGLFIGQVSSVLITLIIEVLFHRLPQIMSLKIHQE